MNNVTKRGFPDIFDIQKPSHRARLAGIMNQPGGEARHEGEQMSGEGPAQGPVVAIVDDEFTLKELSSENGQPILVPHNPAYPVIRPQHGLEIFGVLAGIIRRYR